MSYMIFFVQFFHLKVINNVRQDVGVIIYCSAVHHVHPLLKAERHAVHQDTDVKLILCYIHVSIGDMILYLDLVRWAQPHHVLNPLISTTLYK